MRIFGAILAGGQGRRMGGADKALIPLAGAALIARMIARFAPQVEDLALSANGDPARFAPLGLPVLPDAPPSRGPLSGILAALDWAAPLGATALVSTPVDLPFLPADLVPRLCLAAETAPRGLVLARAGGRAQPATALWPVALRSPLRDFLASGETSRVMGFAARHDPAFADFDADAFANLNAPEDLASAEARIARQA